MSRTLIHKIDLGNIAFILRFMRHWQCIIISFIMLVASLSFNTTIVLMMADGELQTTARYALYIHRHSVFLSLAGAFMLCIFINIHSIRRFFYSCFLSRVLGLNDDVHSSFYMLSTARVCCLGWFWLGQWTEKSSLDAKTFTSHIYFMIVHMHVTRIKQETINMEVWYARGGRIFIWSPLSVDWGSVFANWVGEWQGIMKLVFILLCIICYMLNTCVKDKSIYFDLRWLLFQPKYPWYFPPGGGRQTDERVSAKSQTGGEKRLNW